MRDQVSVAMTWVLGASMHHWRSASVNND